MFQDVQEIADGAELDFDVCIIGAGPAGLTLVAELGRRQLRVCLLETGTTAIQQRHQVLSTSETVSEDDTYLNTRYYRTRAMGGTAHNWCVSIADRLYFRLSQLDAGDFTSRTWLAGSGWPLELSDLAPYYRRAAGVCGLAPLDLVPDPWVTDERRPLDTGDGPLSTTMFGFAPQSTFIEELPAELVASDTVTVIADASAVELLTSADGGTVERVRVRTLGGVQFHVRAGQVALAQGGFEVARLLLASRDHWPSGVGNSSDHLGRHFMDHQIFKAGHLTPSSPEAARRLGFYDIWHHGDVAVTAALALDESVLNSEQLLRSAFMLVPRPPMSAATAIQHLYGRETTARSPAFRSAVTLRRAIKYQRRLPPGTANHLFAMLRGLDDLIYIRKGSEPFFRPRYSIDRGGWFQRLQAGERFDRFDAVQLVEQAPDPDNRITLSSQRDALGMPRTRVRFRWGTQDRRSVCRSQEILANELERIGIGRMKLARRGELPLVRQISAHHPAGTTRMSADPADGVVDADCRVHGVENLYVASASVFPTAGYAPPTFTVIALALRVADRIAASDGRRSDESATTRA